MNKLDREQLLSRWTERSSDSEQDRQDRAERMIREAIRAHKPFDGVPITVYAKGSYANNTNVRLDSDVDIVVECTECAFYDAPPASSPPVGPPYAGRWTPSLWRAEVERALASYFGRSGMDATGAVAILVKEVPGSRPSADVVPSFPYRLYGASLYAPYIEGSAVFRRDGTRIVNWPAQQLANGRQRNIDTGYRYKRFVRALKNAENALADGGMTPKPSFLMECLVWNVPNEHLVAGSMGDGFAMTLAWLLDELENGGYGPWREPNDIKPLFGTAQKWEPQDAYDVLSGTWSLLEY